MHFENPPIVRTQMLIRRPVNEVFEAFVDPAITSRFWFTKSSGRLIAGHEVRWDWEMYDVSTQVKVLHLVENEQIDIQWDDPPTQVQWKFTARPDNTTFVEVTNSGFQGDGDAIIRQALDSQGGFSSVLAAAKALLEHNIVLALVADHFPDAHVKPA